MILGLKTDSSDAVVVLLDSAGNVADEYTWQAHRTLARDLLKVIQDRLGHQGADWQKISGVIVYKGPGSFTGLRIGAAVANTIAHSEKLPIVGTNGDNWLQDGFAALSSGRNDKIVLPHYGAQANITKQRK